MAENKFVSFFVRVGQKMAKSFNEIRLELKKVIWPNRKQLINNTSTVLLTCAVVVAIIVPVDLALGELVKIVFK